MDFEEKVKKIAYELYEKNGRREGRDLLDWLVAEQIIRFQQMILPGTSRERVDLLEYRPLSDADPAPAPPMKPKTRSQKQFRSRRPETGGRALQAERETGPAS